VYFGSHPTSSRVLELFNLLPRGSLVPAKENYKGAMLSQLEATDIIVQVTMFHWFSFSNYRLINQMSTHLWISRTFYWISHFCRLDPSVLACQNVQRENKFSLFKEQVESKRKTHNSRGWRSTYFSSKSSLFYYV
jgi:hypothetical protein